MIARTWHCRISASKADAFEAHLVATGVAEVASAPGNAGHLFLRRDAGEVVHFTLVSFWQSEAAIRAFAGDDPDRAWAHPDDVAFSPDCDPFVTHASVIGLELSSEPEGTKP